MQAHFLRRPQQSRSQLCSTSFVFIVLVVHSFEKKPLSFIENKIAMKMIMFNKPNKFPFSILFLFPFQQKLQNKIKVTVIAVKSFVEETSLLLLFFCETFFSRVVCFENIAVFFFTSSHLNQTLQFFFRQHQRQNEPQKRS